MTSPASFTGPSFDKGDYNSNSNIDDDDDDDYSAVVLTDQGHTFQPPTSPNKAIEKGKKEGEEEEGEEGEEWLSAFPGRDDNDLSGRYGNTRPRNDYYPDDDDAADDDDDDDDNMDGDVTGLALGRKSQNLVINIVIPILILVFVVFVVAAAWLWKR